MFKFASAYVFFYTCLVTDTYMYPTCSDNFAEYVSLNNYSNFFSKQTKETFFQISDENQVTKAIRDIAYYLRNHKFNEWDRRRFTMKPSIDYGFIAKFPDPPLNTIHWKVYENCAKNFFKCIEYLHSVIISAPLTRNLDTSVILNKNQVNFTYNINTNIECLKLLSISDQSGFPFESPLERFQWRTSASYYMCWYTMLNTPILSMIGETCDNFANCLDFEYGRRNYDPRSDDKIPFACATYSFCPDPCCPIKHVHTYLKCDESESNPCLNERYDSKSFKTRCMINRNENTNFKDIISNKWNISCNCRDVGFIWKSKFGNCVDINECVNGEANCDNLTENCLNLPGSYQCICKWSFMFSHKTNKCEKIFFK